ncbi:MAG: succinylglutamate desuccinylase/aspartoacylase family protein [Chthoniobacteraceae bacterium]
MTPLALLDALTPEAPPAPQRRSLRRVLSPLFRNVTESSLMWRAENAGTWETDRGPYWMPRLVFTRPEEKPDFKIGIFAGIHGDEPAGVLALCDFVRALDAMPTDGHGYELHVYPLINPTGYEDGTRHSRSGRDLNREFWRGSPEPEVALLEKEILRERYDGYIALHTDDTSEGFYGFVRGATLTEHLLRPALESVERALPINRGGVIDGFHAVDGIIHSAYDGILSAPPGAKPTPFEIILESPADAPMHLQRAGFVLATAEILTHFRRLIAYGGDL